MLRPMLKTLFATDFASGPAKPIVRYYYDQRMGPSTMLTPRTGRTTVPRSHRPNKTSVVSEYLSYSAEKWGEERL